MKNQQKQGDLPELIAHWAEVPVMGLWGWEMISVPLAEIDRFKADQIGVAAEHFKLSRADYVRWVEWGGSVQCMAITKRGKRCRKSSPGSLQPEDWLALEREGYLCETHGGWSASAS